MVREGLEKSRGEGTLVRASQIWTGGRTPEQTSHWSGDEKYLACMLPLPCPVLRADIANQSQQAVLKVWTWLHSPCQYHYYQSNGLGMREEPYGASLKPSQDLTHVLLPTSSTFEGSIS